LKEKREAMRNRFDDSHLTPKPLEKNKRMSDLTSSEKKEMNEGIN